MVLVRAVARYFAFAIFLLKPAFASLDLQPQVFLTNGCNRALAISPARRLTHFSALSLEQSSNQTIDPRKVEPSLRAVLEREYGPKISFGSLSRELLEVDALQGHTQFQAFVHLQFSEGSPLKGVTIEVEPQCLTKEATYPSIFRIEREGYVETYHRLHPLISERPDRIRASNTVRKALVHGMLMRLFGVATQVNDIRLERVEYLQGELIDALMLVDRRPSQERYPTNPEFLGDLQTLMFIEAHVDFQKSSEGVGRFFEQPFAGYLGSLYPSIPRLAKDLVGRQVLGSTLPDENSIEFKQRLKSISASEIARRLDLLVTDVELEGLLFRKAIAEHALGRP